MKMKNDILSKLKKENEELKRKMEIKDIQIRTLKSIIDRHKDLERQFHEAIVQAKVSKNAFDNLVKNFRNENK